MNVQTYRRVRQTKFVRDGWKGLLTLHDDGRIAVSVDHKALFSGLNFFVHRSYHCIDHPTTPEMTLVMDRLFGMD